MKTNTKNTALKALVAARHNASTAVDYADRAEREAHKARVEAQATLAEIQNAINALQV